MMKLKYLLFLFISLAIMSCGEKKQVKEKPLKPVKYSKIVSDQNTGMKTFNGISKSGAETKLSFRSNGLIVFLEVKNGERVKKGDILAKLDQKDIALSYDKSKASVASARSQMNLSKSNLDRIKELYQSNSASLNEYDNAKNSYANALANYENAQKSMNIQASQFEYSIIKAPIDGIIAQVNADVNEFAQAGSPIFVMNSDGDDLEITVGVSETYISKVKQGEEVDVKINGKDIKGLISEVAFSTGATMTYSVVIKLVDPSNDLRPGMPAEVTFSFGSDSASSEQLIVPVKGVGNDSKGDFVFILRPKPDGVYEVEKVHVQLGNLINNGFIVNEGIQRGDIIATAGLRTLHTGMNVQLLN